MASSVHSGWRTPTVVLVCAGLVLSLAMGIRHGFGLFLQPMSLDLHWGRETNGIVGQIFGVRYLAMLSGFTFFSHQMGSFLGAWLGGRLYDQTGSYDVVWGISIALGVVAGLLNLPIDERAIRGPAAVPA